MIATLTSHFPPTRPCTGSTFFISAELAADAFVIILFKILEGSVGWAYIHWIRRLLAIRVIYDSRAFICPYIMSHVRTSTCRRARIYFVVLVPFLGHLLFLLSRFPLYTTRYLSICLFATWEKTWQYKHICSIIGYCLVGRDPTPTLPYMNFVWKKWGVFYFWKKMSTTLKFTQQDIPWFPCLILHNNSVIVVVLRTRSSGKNTNGIGIPLWAGLFGQIDSFTLESTTLSTFSSVVGRWWIWCPKYYVPTRI